MLNIPAGGNAKSIEGSPLVEKSIPGGLLLCLLICMNVLTTSTRLLLSTEYT